MLDDIAIWDRALSADEVGSLNSGGIPAQNATLRTVGLNFGADAPDGSNGGTMEAEAKAGLPGFAQQNWNSLAGATGSSDEVVANDGSSTGSR